MERFGKPSADIAKSINAFREQNAPLLAEALRVAKVYTQQPLRKFCKICASSLPSEHAFRKHDVSYCLCGTCGHLNGMHEDTDEFCRAVYVDDGGQAYADAFLTEDRAAFDGRVERVYRPKVAFLKDALMADGKEPVTLSYADVGAGSGHLVSAARNAGLRCSGYEVSTEQTAFANRMVGADAVSTFDMARTTELAASIGAEVVTAIGVLEHLQDPRAFLDALSKNGRVRYLFASVPMYSASTFIEMAFSDVMPRHLSGGHTHLFTKSSLVWLAEHFGFKCVSSWWFGSDMADLYRSIALHMPNRAMGEEWLRAMSPLIDKLQLAIDRERASSEVHVLYRNR